MTSIDELRDAVIEAARVWRFTLDDDEEASGILVDAVDKLRFAEEPDLWALLKRARRTAALPLKLDIEKALAWKEANG